MHRGKHDSAKGRPQARGRAVIRHAWGDLAEAQDIMKDRREQALMLNMPGGGARFPPARLKNHDSGNTEESARRGRASAVGNN